jgi:hypothetical protein
MSSGLSIEVKTGLRIFVMAKVCKMLGAIVLNALSRILGIGWRKCEPVNEKAQKSGAYTLI